MGSLPGVYRTRVGYTGGEKKFPTYHDLGDHTEALQVDFDPTQVSYADIVDLFWRTHNPLRGRRNRQYMTAIWYHDDDQHQIIDAAKQKVQQRLEAPVQTPILSLDVFYLAEDYHQKYWLQNSPLMKRFDQFYPKFSDFTDSHAAARLNGFMGGNGSRKLFDAEQVQYGFAPEELKSITRLQDFYGNRHA